MIISSNPNVDFPLAFIESGHYDSSIAELGGFDMFLERSTLFAVLPPPDTLPQLRARNSTIDTVITSIGPLVSVQWGQSDDEGVYCPNGIAGCSNVAAAQIMSYFMYPLQMSLTFDNSPYTSMIIDWPELNNHQTSHFYVDTCYASNDAHITLGLLHRQLGKLNNSIYYTEPDSSTSTYASDVRNTFINLGYIGVSQIQQYNGGSFMNDLTDGYLVYHYFHINWGWYGICNGWFYSGVFDINNAYSVDFPNRTTSGSGNYNIDNRYFLVKL